MDFTRLEKPDQFGNHNKLAGGHPYPAWEAITLGNPVPYEWTGDPRHPGCDARMNMEIWFGTYNRFMDGGVRCCADMEYVDGKWQMATE
ncbi:MAG: hypothetical protein Kow0090_05050 [Myxococcota bacterium]